MQAQLAGPCFCQWFCYLMLNNKKVFWMGLEPAQIACLYDQSQSESPWVSLHQAGTDRLNALDMPA
jgi:hypothetical protein